MQLRWKLLLVLVIVAGLLGVTRVSAGAQTAASKVFTTEELATFDGKNGHPAYYAYEGKVYDVTGSKLWMEGEHFGLHAGSDLTGKMTGAPHGTEVFAGFAVVGTYGVTPAATVAPSTAVTAPGAPSAPAAPVMNSSKPASPWYATRIKIAGISILGWTGILLGVFFVLTFGTCFAMPWAKLPLPWKGSKLGPDPLDASGKHLTWSSIHKYFVWFTVILGVIHGILGFLQMFFGLYL